MDVVGYVRTLAWGPAAVTEPGPQEQDIHSWAEARGHRVTAVVHDELIPGSEDLEHRLALAKALEMVRDGQAQAMVVASLDRLAGDLLLQERLLADIRASGGSVFSADADEEKDLANEPRDGMRAVVRRVLSTSGEYERSKRALLINRQVARTGTPRDRQQAAMARIEALARDGASIEEIAGRLRAEGLTPSSGFLFSLARLRRIIAVTEADRTELTSGALKSQSPWRTGT